MSFFFHQTVPSGTIRLCLMPFILFKFSLSYSSFKTFPRCPGRNFLVSETPVKCELQVFRTLVKCKMLVSRTPASCFLTVHCFCQTIATAFKAIFKKWSKDSKSIIYYKNTFDSCFKKMSIFIISDRLTSVPYTRETF